MTEGTLQPPGSPGSKVDPETLVLKASPRRVVRFKRKLLIGVAAVGMFGIFGVTWLALKGPVLRFGQSVQELYSTDRKSTPEGLANLPSDYGQLYPDVPVLGPPLPGDLGRPILERQRQLGLAPGGPAGLSREEQEAEAERQRLAQQARQAREAGVFFQIASRISSAMAQGVTSGQGADSTSLAASAGVASDRLALDPDRDPNHQQRKLDFLSGQAAGGIYNPHALEVPVSPYQVMAGSVIAAALITGLNSDLPGDAEAQVTENVYDTVTGQVLLIPQGARLVGAYDSVVAYGQSRALLVWRRIIMPDGSSIEIDNLPATDAAGYAGLEDDVDFHTWRLIKGVALATLLGVGNELSLGSNETDLVRALWQSTQQGVGEASQRLVEKNLSIQPTIAVRPGWPLRVIVQKDLVLRPYRG